MISHPAIRLFFRTTTVVLSSMSTTAYENDAHTMLRMSGGSRLATAVGDGEVWTLPLVPHHRALDRFRRERRELGLADPAPPTDRPSQSRYTKYKDMQQVGALYQGYGTHYVDLWVGTPFQRQTVIVDTGSGVTAFPCSGCHDCGAAPDYHTDKYFIEDDSSSFYKLGCNECSRGRCTNIGGKKGCKISMSYQEGSSWAAYEGRDVAYIGGPHDEPLDPLEQGESGDNPDHASSFAFPLDFGCQISLTGLFKTQLADGIMGMDNAGSSFWKQMYGHSMIKEKKFSLCFARQSTTTREGTEAGAMTMGGVDTNLHLSPMVFAQNVRSSGFFTVHVTKMYLRDGSGGEFAKSSDDEAEVVQLDVSEQNLNSGGVIVDSGTTDTYLNRRMADPFKAAYKLLTGKNYNNKATKMTFEEVKKLPTIMFQIKAAPTGPEDTAPGADANLAGALDPSSPNDIVIAVPATHYMEYDESNGMYTARVYLDEGGGSVFGANTMMGHDILFDVDGKRLGWAESRCDYTNYVNEKFRAKDNVDKNTETEFMESTNEVVEEETEESANEEMENVIEESEEETTEEEGVCTSNTCRGYVAAGLLGVAVVGIVSWRTLSPRTREVYHTTEIEVPTMPVEGGYSDNVEEEDNIPVPPPIS